MRESVPDRAQLQSFRDEVSTFLKDKLLPFWFERSRDTKPSGEPGTEVYSDNPAVSPGGEAAHHL